MRTKFSIFNFQFSTLELLFLLILASLFFFTRLYRLTKVPVFCDEAIYIRWAQIMRNEPSLRFLPLQDGKQPLFMWLVMPMLKLFSDPLFAGRFASVLAGLAVLFAVLIYQYINTKRWRWWVGLIYIFLPFSVFFDRMALVDSLLAAFGVWALNFAVLLGMTLRLDVAMILGMILGGSLLTKSPGMFFVILAPVVAALQLMVNSEKSKVKLKVKSLIKLISLIFVSLAIAFAIYNILRLGPNFHMIKIRNKDYIYSLSELKQYPLHPFLENIKSVGRYYWHYLTPPILFLGLMGILVEIKRFASLKFAWRNLGILLWWGIPLLTQAAIAKVFTARYILFSVPVFILFASFGLRLILEKIKKIARDPLMRRALTLLTLILILSPAFYFDWQLWRNPAQANFPQDERKGYLEDWTAGWGIKSIADYLKQLPKDKNIVVGTEGFFGTLPEGLQIYLEKESKITVIGVGYPIKAIPESLVNAKKAGDRVYLVVNQSRLEMGNQKGLKLIRAYEKPGGDRLLFFEISNF